MHKTIKLATRTTTNVGVTSGPLEEQAFPADYRHPSCYSFKKNPMLSHLQMCPIRCQYLSQTTKTI
jgi:hypothetical protein